LEDEAMGADIYLESAFNAKQAVAKPKFEAAVAKRDKAKAKAAKDAAQAEVEKWYSEMYSDGYFRDSYNSGSLFWFLGLSWWQLAEELCEDGYLPVQHAQTVIDRIQAVGITEERLAGWVAKKREEGWTFSGDQGSPEQWRDRFKEDAQDLCNLLRRSIELNEPLLWSV
jgi:hypothetical protein